MPRAGDRFVRNTNRDHSRFPQPERRAPRKQWAEVVYFANSNSDAIAASNENVVTASTTTAAATTPAAATTSAETSSLADQTAR